MPYNNFTLEAVEATFGLTTTPVDLFAAVEPIAVPPGLAELVAWSRRGTALTSEKARSEFLIAPILSAVGLMLGPDHPLTIYSGQWLQVDEARGLTGECDFILARTAAVPRLKAPLLMILEAKRGIIELGLGQCAAQMIAGRMFNEQAGGAARPMFGAVTTGNEWQFLKLDGTDLWFDSRLYYLSELRAILGALHSIVTS